MKPLLSVFAAFLVSISLGLAAGLAQGQTRLPMPQAAPVFPPSVFSFRASPGVRPVTPFLQSPHTPGDAVPRTYMVYGLRTGPGGMAFTDQSGKVIPLPSRTLFIGKLFRPLPFSPPHIVPLPAPKK